MATTKLTPAEAQAAVQSFQETAASMKTNISTEKDFIGDVNTRTSSAWIKQYANQFESALGDEVQKAVQEIDKTASKLQQIIDVIIAEDQG